MSRTIGIVKSFCVDDINRLSDQFFLGIAVHPTKVIITIDDRPGSGGMIRIYENDPVGAVLKQDPEAFFCFP